MSYLFDSTSPTTNPPDTEAVRLGAQRIRELKDALQAYLAAVGMTNTGTYPNPTPTLGTNVVPGSLLQNNSVTATQLANQGVGAAALAAAAFGNGLTGANGTPVSVNVDNITLGFDAASPPHVQVIGLPKNQAPVVNSASNLVVQTTGNGTLTIAADEVVLKNSSGNPYLATSVSVTANGSLGVALNGLETGATLTASTWYYIWLISNGTSVAAVLEDGSSVQNGGGSGVLPNGPNLSNSAFSGYTYKALVGSVRTNASSIFNTFYQTDRNVYINDFSLQSVFNQGELGGSTSYFEMTTYLPGVCPPNAKSFRGTAGMASTSVNDSIALAANANGLGAITVGSSVSGEGLNTFTCGGMYNIPIITQQAFWIKTSRADTNYEISVSGYTI